MARLAFWRFPIPLFHFTDAPILTLPRERGREWWGSGEQSLASGDQNSLTSRVEGMEKNALELLDLERLRATPLTHDPFEFVVVDGFVREDALPAILADFPEIRGTGSFPIDTVAHGPAFAELAAALRGSALRCAIEEKFELDLGDHPTVLTVRGRSDGRDGHIHTDSPSKIITLLLYMNPVWEYPAGRLRLLRGPGDLEDYAREVAPLAGTMLAFRRSDRSFHGHYPHYGERRSLQLNWVSDSTAVRRELGRHRWSARFKALNPFVVLQHGNAASKTPPER
jgi:SM-20-related protein